MELKFRYVYGIPGKPETYFFRYFTIEEIEAQKFVKELWPYRGADYEIISRDQFTGYIKNVYKDIYENDLISDNLGDGRIEYIEKYAAFRVNYGNGECKWFYDYLDTELKSIEVIGNTHGVKS